MLTPRSADGRSISARLMRRERKLWDQPKLTPSLGCHLCKQFGDCGGLRTAAHLIDCMGLCCGKPETCTKVCRAKPSDFVLRIREVGGFDLATVPRSPVLNLPSLPAVVPLFFHGGRREYPYRGGAVALPLYSLIRRADGELKYGSRAELCAAFKIAEDATIILTGTAQDLPLERWWGYGEQRGREIICALRDLGIALISTPNFSLFADAPRWDDLHSMKRIGLTYAQLTQSGMPTALHVNGRTNRDFERWANFLIERPEVTILAYEFGTGAGRADRAALHAGWLARLAQAVERPLHLLVRGGLDVLPLLATHFASVTLLETSAFMKTQHRQRAIAHGNAAWRWEAAPTAVGEPLDDLLLHNIKTVSGAIELLTAPLCSWPATPAA